MGRVEELYQKAKVFHEIFGTVYVVVETDNCFNYEDQRYDKFLLAVKNRVDLLEGEILSEITSVEGAIHAEIIRFFKPSIPEQVVSYTSQTPLFSVDVEELLFTDDWLTEFYDMLLDSIEEDFSTIQVRDSNGDKDKYSFRVRDVYFYEFNHYSNDPE
ncbi:MULTISPECIES: hypothetical protein [Bacillaceae]|uniref:Uncharacterized protein n=1 Tax=Evansella alkalicola TaxID=745819 RepID=A0ABS6JTI2_9BACI|nr:MULTISPECIES: hypothetical protein [Bacillaceae]MBU9721552.1 hypothetical protein [Bacillus alkalicola]